VIISAAASNGYAFTSWGGDLTGSATPQTVTVTGNMSVSAVFTLIPYTVTLNQGTGGTITVSPSKTSYTYGEIVSVSATADSGYAFSSWGGDLSGTTNPQTFTISKNMSISATFSPITYTITLTQSTGGTIAVSPSKSTYNSGENVTVTATADSGYVFSAWGGDLVGSTTPHSFNISKNMTISATFSISSTIPRNGLVAEYLFNGNANDTSGYGNNGTVYGAAPLTADRFGSASKAYDFSSYTQYIRVPDSSTLKFSTGVTVSAWVYYRSGSYILSKDDSSGGSNLGLQPNWWAVNPSSSYAVTTTVVPSLNVWHHIVGTYDMSAIKLYVDNVLQGSKSATFSMSSNSNPMVIGQKNYAPGTSGNFDLNGIIDDIRIYTRALSDTEIQALYSEGGWTGPAPSVVVGGLYRNLSGTYTGCYWRDGAKTDLSDLGAYGWLYSICEYNNTIYSTGYSKPTSTASSSRGHYWVGTTKYDLLPGTEANPFDIAVENGDIYVCGRSFEGSDVAWYFKNGVRTVLYTVYTSANGIKIRSGVPYIAGQHGAAGSVIINYWVGTTETQLYTGGLGGESGKSIWLDGNDVYVCGYYNRTYGGWRPAACFWKNNSSQRVDLLLSVDESRAWSIQVKDGKVYVCGYYNNGTNPVACYWVYDGTTVTKKDLYLYSTSAAYAIRVDNAGNVYVAGGYQVGSEYRACYWVNDSSTRVDLAPTTDSYATSLLLLH
jgi:hypothetical protein